MKYLKRFNESMEEQIYNQVLDSIKDCFQEFEDNGWSWHSAVSSQPIPYFKYIMKDGNKEEIKYYIDCVGSIDSNGVIKWESKDIYHAETLIQQQYPRCLGYKDVKIKRKKFEITEGPILEEFEDFTVAIKRLHDDTGLDLYFSYDNIDGQKRIIIQGRI